MKVASGNEFLNPQKILHEVGLTYGHRVADLGCGGAGYFVLQASKIVGDRGIVYGVDVLKHALSGLKSKLELEGTRNVILVWSNLEIYGAAKQIKDGSLDIAFLINTLFQSKSKGAIIKEATRIISPGGKLLVIDWKTGGLTFGPNEKDLVSPREIQQHAETNGLTLEKAFDPGQYHFGLLFKK